MKTVFLERMNVLLASLTLIALVTGTFGFAVPRASADEGMVQVTISKYINGALATAGTANNADFPMSATWNASNIGAGTGSYALSELNTIPYEASTALMTSGADYSTSEQLDGEVVAATCETGAPFSLVGYTTGSTLSEAQGGTPTLTPPAFTNITSDKYVIVWNYDCATPLPSTVQVTIDKYIDGYAATTETAQGESFPMHASWNDPEGAGSGSGMYTLSSTSDPAYRAQTIEMQSGADYSTNENTEGSTVGATCDSGQPFELVGYTTGSTLSEAQEGTPTLTSPTFTDMTHDQYVIVWNATCDTDETVTVTIVKFIDGHQANVSNGDGKDFSMNATWDDPEGIGSGTDAYTLGPAGFNGDPAPYKAVTAEMMPGADYSTSEVIDGVVVGTMCSTSTPPHFTLTGYTTGTTLGAAIAGTPTTTAPSFTNMTHDQYVIVWNHACDGTPDGDLEGEVTGGVNGQGELEVTSIEATKTTAVANGTFADGWKYTFNLTVPTNETNVAMKFANWMSTVGSSTILVANNMRISSAQADNGGATVLLTAANTYSAPPLHMVTDLGSTTPGIQVQVLVEVSVPSTTVNGAYTTTYAVQSL